MSSNNPHLGAPARTAVRLPRCRPRRSRPRPCRRIGQDANGQPLQTGRRCQPGLTGQPVLGGTQTNTLTMSGGTQIGDPANPAPLQTASADGSFVTIDSVGTVPNAPGRDLTGGLTIEKLLGGWTIVSGADQCKLNLTYTAKTGTNRYRASTPGLRAAGAQGGCLVAAHRHAGAAVRRERRHRRGDDPLGQSLHRHSGRWPGHLDGWLSWPRRGRFPTHSPPLSPRAP